MVANQFDVKQTTHFLAIEDFIAQILTGQMEIYMHMYIYIYVHTYYIYTHVYLHVHTLLYIYIYNMYIHTPSHTYILCIYTNIHIHIHIYIYIHTHIHTYIHTYIYVLKLCIRLTEQDTFLTLEGCNRQNHMSNLSSNRQLSAFPTSPGGGNGEEVGRFVSRVMSRCQPRRVKLSQIWGAKL